MPKLGKNPLVEPGRFARDQVPGITARPSAPGRRSPACGRSVGAKSITDASPATRFPAVLRSGWRITSGTCITSELSSHGCFCKIALLAQVRPVIRGEDDDRVVQELHLLHGLQEPANAVVHVAHLGRVEVAEQAAGRGRKFIPLPVFEGSGRKIS